MKFCWWICPSSCDVNIVPRFGVVRYGRTHDVEASNYTGHHRFHGSECWIASGEYMAFYPFHNYKGHRAPIPKQPAIATFFLKELINNITYILIFLCFAMGKYISFSHHYGAKVKKPGRMSIFESHHNSEVDLGANLFMALKLCKIYGWSWVHSSGFLSPVGLDRGPVSHLTLFRYGEVQFLTFQTLNQEILECLT